MSEISKADALLYSQTHVGPVWVYFSIMFRSLRSKEFSQPMQPGDTITITMDKDSALNVVKSSAYPNTIFPTW